jgi:hypothetical protein
MAAIVVQAFIGYGVTALLVGVALWAPKAGYTITLWGTRIQPQHLLILGCAVGAYATLRLIFGIVSEIRQRRLMK